MDLKQIGALFIIILFLLSGLVGVLYSTGATAGVSLTVGNSAPNITSININSTTHIDNIYHTSSLVCSIIFSDDNGDNCTVDFVYYKNGVLQGDFNTTMTEQINGSIIYANVTVPNSNLTIGDNWSCGALINDSFLTDEDNSTQKTVEDGITVNQLTNDPTTPTAGFPLGCMFNISYPNNDTYDFTVYTYYQKNESDVLTWLYSYNSTDTSNDNSISYATNETNFMEIILGHSYRCYINISDGNKSYAEYSTWGIAVIGGSGGGGDEPPLEECSTNQDCLDNQVCVLNKCEDLICDEGFEAFNHTCIEITEVSEEPEEPPPEEEEIIDKIDETIYEPISEDLADEKLWLEKTFGKDNLVVFIIFFSFIFLILLIILLADKKRKESSFFKALLAIILGVILFLLLIVEKDVFGAYLITLTMAIMGIAGLLCLTVPAFKYGTLTIGVFFLGTGIFANELLWDLMKKVILGG